MLNTIEKYSDTDLSKIYLECSKDTNKTVNSILFEEIVENKKSFKIKHYLEIEKITGIALKEMFEEEKIEIKIPNNLTEDELQEFKEFTNKMEILFAQYIKMSRIKKEGSIDN